MKKNNINILRNALLLLVLLTNQLVTYAVVNSEVETNNGLNLTTDLTVESDRHDEIIPGWETQFGIREVNNQITFGIDQDMLQVDDAYAYKIVFDLTWDELDGTTFSTSSLSDIELALNYDPDGAYQDKEVYTFSGGLEVTIHNIRLYKKDDAGVYVLTPVDRDNLFLASEIITESYNNFDYSAIPTPSIESITIDGSDVEMTWPVLDGAEAYDVEWTWVNGYHVAEDGEFLGTLSDSLVLYNFKDNASRVRVTSNTYRVPMIYGDGYILFRYRGVGRTLDNLNLTVDGAWMDALECDTVHNFPDQCKVQVTAFENNAMNYGASITLVEEGKRSAAVTYMDGVMKTRQTQSQLSSQEELVVGSTIYDYYGRPAIGVMGSPVKQTELGYVENLNMASATMPYDKAVFHADTLLLGDCGPKAALPMSAADSKGSANYYSAENTNKTGAEAFVPEANGYNFTQIHYTNDPTGRVKRVGGVGPDHQLGHNGHYTETIFDVPDEDEVDGLLGSEAADVVNYTKVITKDVHGQISVAILDNQGRTVISYLEGSAPAGLDTIEGNDTLSPVQVDLVGLTSSSEELDAAGILQVNKKIAVADPAQVYTFNYDFTSLSYTDCTPPDICFDCIYEVEFKVTPVEGAFSTICPLRKDGAITTETVWNHTIGNITSFDINCDAPIQFSDENPSSFTLQFPRFGEYYVTKTLKVSQAPIEYYWEEYVNHADASCLTPYSTFLTDAIMNIDYSSCYDGTPCELNFLFTHGTLEQYLETTPGATEAMYNTLREESIIACENQPICAQMRPMLLADVRPGGQYGEVTGTDPLSVFNESASSLLTDNWRTVAFTNLDGTPAKTENSEGVEVDVNDASISLEEFLVLFQSHWAEALLVAHPEYETYRFCELYSEVFDYGIDFKLTETYADALAAGYITPFDPADYPATFGGSPALYNSATADPLDELISTTLASTLEGSAYLYDDATVTGNNYKELCESILGSSAGTTLYQNVSAMTDGADFGTSSCDVDRQWQVFRDLYLGRRNLVLQVVMEGRAVEIATGGDRIQCIDYDESSLCGSYGMYASKTKRFPLFDQLMPFTLVQLLTGDPAATTDMVPVIESEISDFCETTCASMAEGWMEELAGCASAMDIPDDFVDGQIWAPLSTAAPGEEEKHYFYKSVKEQLIAVCSGGCSSDHPLPSQYHLSPPSPELASFETVIEQYLPGNIETLECNHYLVSFPSSVQNESLIEKLDTCSCNKLLSVADETAFETEFGFVPIDFCRDRAACADAKAGITIDNIYDIESIMWSNAEINDLTTISTLTDYGCDGDKCIKCTQLTQSINDFQLEFPGASIEEDAGMFTSFINQQYGTTFDYYSLITFKENCEALSSGEEITDGFHPAAVQLVNFMNAVIPGGLNSSSAEAQYHPYSTFPLLMDYASVDLVEDGDYRYFINSINSNSFVFTLGANAIGSSAYYFCVRESFRVTTSELGGYASMTELMPNIIGFGTMYVTTADFSLGNRFHVTGAVVNPDGGTPIEIEFVFESACIPVFDDVSKLCSNYTPIVTDDCEAALIASATYTAETAYGEYLAAKKEEFITNYIETCAQVNETYNYEYHANRYHYTLAYYDRAGNLVKTVPPKGVKEPGELGGLTAADIADLQAHRAGVPGASPHYPAHTMETKYTYNALNQPVTTTTPDGGTSQFWYDNIARLVVSQNARQADMEINEILGNPLVDGPNTTAYSYTRFDYLGRPIEAGEFVQPTAISSAITKNPTDFENWLFEEGAGHYRNQVMFMGYSNATHTDALAELGAEGQGDIRNRVSSTATVQGYVPMATDWSYPLPDYFNHYQYDVHGNVKTYLQEISDLSEEGRRFLRTDYEYDLLTSLPKYTHFQQGKVDQFSHRYVYDEDNRLTEVHTSKDGVIWDRDGEYTYRLDGKLARTELGDLQVQGCDYAYTLQGWLKAMNSGVLDAERDMGKDGAASSSSTVAQDALAFTLGYYGGDYKAIDDVDGDNFLIDPSFTPFHLTQKSLYNGNISSVITAMIDLDENPIAVTGTNYQYDQLHRFKESHVFTADDITELNSFVHATRKNQVTGTSGNSLGDYEVHVDYDPNGNITRLDRRAYQHDAVTNQMDEFTYNYPEASINNLLGHVQDDVSGTPYDDIKAGQELLPTDYPDYDHNYEYHADGTLKSDLQEEIGYLEWYPNGKLKRVFRNEGTASDLYFEYDVNGTRVLKVEMPRDAGGVLLPEEQWNYTWYGLDANGVPLGVYQKTESDANLHRMEASIYGSKRLGLDTRKVPIELVDGMYSLDDFVLGTANCGPVGEWFIPTSTTHELADFNDDEVTDLRITNLTGAASATMTIQTMPGETYTVTYDLLDKTGTHIVERPYSCSPIANLGPTTIYTLGSQSFTFMATTEKSLVQWRGPSTGGTFTISNINIEGPGDIFGGLVNDEDVALDDKHQRIIGQKMYELGDHLGNVKEVITDRKIVEEITDEYSFNDFLLGRHCSVPGRWDLSGGTSHTVSDVNGDSRPDLTLSNSAGAFHSFLTIETVPGNVYTVSYTVLALSGSSIFGHAYKCGIDDQLGTFSGGVGTHTYSFEAETPLTRLMWGRHAAGSFTITNIKVEGEGSNIFGDTDIAYDIDDFTTGSQCGTPGDWNVFSGTSHTLSDVNGDGRTDVTFSKSTGTFHSFLTIQTEIGATYTVTYDALNFTGGITYVVGKAYRCGSDVNIGGSVVGSGTHSYTFVAETPKTRLQWLSDVAGGFTLANIDINGPGEIFGVPVIEEEPLLAYLPDVVSFKDYYPYGMEMPGRKGAVSGAEGYRYAFNGMEQDQEVSGSGNSYTTMFRQYDPRLGRWKSLDPLMAKYPGASPYSAYNDNPIYFIDPNGLEGLIYNGHEDETKKKSASKKRHKKDSMGKNKDIDNTNSEVKNAEALSVPIPDATDLTASYTPAVSLNSDEMEEFMEITRLREETVENVLNQIYDELFPGGTSMSSESNSDSEISPEEEGRRAAIASTFKISVNLVKDSEGNNLVSSVDISIDLEGVPDIDSEDFSRLYAISKKLGKKAGFQIAMHTVRQFGMPSVLNKSIGITAGLLFTPTSMGTGDAPQDDMRRALEYGNKKAFESGYMGALSKISNATTPALPVSNPNYLLLETKKDKTDIQLNSPIK